MRHSDDKERISHKVDARAHGEQTSADNGLSESVRATEDDILDYVVSRGDKNSGGRPSNKALTAACAEIDRLMHDGYSIESAALAVIDSEQFAQSHKDVDSLVRQYHERRNRSLHEQIAQAVVDGDEKRGVPLLQQLNRRERTGELRRTRKNSS